MNPFRRTFRCPRTCLPARSRALPYGADLIMPHPSSADFAAGALGHVSRGSIEGASAVLELPRAVADVCRQECKSSTRRPQPCTRAYPMPWSPSPESRDSGPCGGVSRASSSAQVLPMPCTLHPTRLPSMLWAEMRVGARSITRSQQVRSLQTGIPTASADRPCSSRKWCGCHHHQRCLDEPL